MPVELEPPLTSSLASIRRPGERIERALTHGPALYLSRGGGRSPNPRWHRIRWGIFYPEHTWITEAYSMPAHPGGPEYHVPRSEHHTHAYTCWHAWCGPTAFDSPNHPPLRTTDLLPADTQWPLCGTCEGRAVGAGYPAHSGEPLHPLLFTPRRLDPPAVCPGAGRRYGGGPGPYSTWEEVPDLRAVLCLVCGQVTGWWGDRIKKHPPGPDLVPGCPQHAWTGLLRVEGRIVCACQTIYEEEETG